MMSPASLSSFVGVDQTGGPAFDVVVFDEASQMRVMEAVYCMSYARQSVIVGDRKQLPPTNFFRGGLTDAEDSDDFVESVLEEFGGVFREEGPSATRVGLLSHYRSETPDLIAFNNARFYDGSLEVCPPRVVSGTGLKHEYVPEGRFVGQINRAEAERIVELVAEHVSKRPERSLGVVVMNYNQMELVEKLLADAPGFVQLFMSDEDSFFLRNLETVQGDEADHIILGLTYGKGEDGRFSAASLGPLTKTGGHRRLNVATSRSRLGMTVVSSLTDHDLAGSSAASEGFQRFREFLAYLRQAKADNDFGITQKAPSEKSGPSQDLLACGKVFESEVIEFLQAAGLDVRPGYGAGRYRIDIVIRESGRNLLAVECDGASYHAMSTARTRDRARQEFLSSKGWRFHRVWSRDWYHDRDAEQGRLMAAVREAREAKGEPAVV
jgi:superfamily I DNA and/or RNA helicase/very-short-patch-repair endonuclease